MKIPLGSLATAAAFLVAGSAHAAHVTCVGDSITAGTGLSSPSTQSYPAALQSLLGAAFAVENDGHSGATLLHNGDLPYTSVGEYTTSSAWAAGGADVVIQLGTNDSKPGNWAKKASFGGDCEALVDHYRAAGAARVWINLIPPAFAGACCSIDGTVVKDEILPLLRQCAANKSASTIDVYSALVPHPEYFDDGVHPNPTGAALLAATVRDALVRLPIVTTSASAATFPAATPVTMTSVPVAAYGKIESVDIYEGGAKLGGATGAPWTVTLTGLAAGSHTLHAIAKETGGRTASSADLTIVIEAPPPPPPPNPPDASIPVDAADGAAVDAASPTADAASAAPPGVTPPAPNAGTRTNDASAATSSADPTEADGCNLGAGAPISATTGLVFVVFAARFRRRRR